MAVLERCFVCSYWKPEGANCPKCFQGAAGYHCSVCGTHGALASNEVHWCPGPDLLGPPPTVLVPIPDWTIEQRAAYAGLSVEQVRRLGE